MQQTAVTEMFRAAVEYEDNRKAAQAEAREEVRDRHAAVLLLISRRNYSMNRPAYELMTRAINKLDKYVDQILSVLEVL